MIEKNIQPRQPSSPEPETKPVVVNDVQQQVRRKTPAPLSGAALEALDRFTQIGAALGLQPLPPIITLIAIPRKVSSPQEPVTLTWTSQFAEKVSITNNVDTAVLLATPVSGGSIEFFVSSTRTFTATAIGPCGSATATVNVDFGGVIL
jgi:hypothetical protein